MIEGKQKNNKPIPEKLNDAFALLNYSIDVCLSGDKYAYILNTNTIIKQIYNALPADYKESHNYIKDIDDESMLQLIDNCRPRLGVPYMTRNR